MKLIPPTTATWMLEHLVLGKRNEALEGDLLEEFQRRGSAGWYWGQVLRAVLLSFSRTLWAGCAVAWTVAFAGFWVYFWVPGKIEPAPSTVHWWPRGYPFWMALGILWYIAAPLAAYLALTRNLTLRAFAVGLGVGAAGHVIVFSTMLHPLPFFHPLYRGVEAFSWYCEAHAYAAHWSAIVWGQWSLLFPPLLAAIAVTKVKGSVLRRLPGTVATTFKNVMLGSNYE